MNWEIQQYKKNVEVKKRREEGEGKIERKDSKILNEQMKKNECEKTE